MFGFAAQYGGVPDAVCVGGGGVETDETPLADNLAVGVEFLDADLVKIGRTVDAATLLRFVEQQAVVVQPLFFVGIGKGGKIVGNQIAVTGENALRGVGFGLQARLPEWLTKSYSQKPIRRKWRSASQLRKETISASWLRPSFRIIWLTKQKLAAQFVFAFHNCAQFG